MKKATVILTLISLILLCGCAGYREINRGYLVTAIGLLPTDSGISITVEAISSSDTLDKPSEKTTLSGDGITVADALHALEGQIVKPLYFEQLGAVVIDDSSDKKSIAQFLEFCGNLQSVSLGVYVVKTPDIAALFNLETDSGVLGYDIIGIIKNYEKTQSQDIQNQLYQLKRDRLADKDISLPSVEVKADKLNLEVFGD